MNFIRVDHPELSFRNEYDSLRDVYFRNEPYTGRIIDHGEETDYVNGKAHGTCISRYEGGQTASIAYYHEGELTEGRSYYASGELRTEYTLVSYRYWGKNGVLAMEVDPGYGTRSYFDHGAIKYLAGGEGKAWRRTYYARNGETIITQLPESQTQYEDDALLRHYHYLLYRDYPELKDEQSYDMDETHRLHLIWMWFWKVFHQNKQQYFSIVNQLLQHPDPAVIEKIAGIIAIHKFEPYIEPENEVNAMAYALIRQNRAYQDEKFPNRDYLKVEL